MGDRKMWKLDSTWHRVSGPPVVVRVAGCGSSRPARDYIRLQHRFSAFQHAGSSPTANNSGEKLVLQQNCRTAVVRVVMTLSARERGGLI
ncbi:hypothetical protein ACOMHN_062013 [Nucella lapillus]